MKAWNPGRVARRVAPAAVAAVAAILAWSRLGIGEEVAMMADGRQPVREASGGGRWFPGEREELKRMIAGFLKAAEVPKIPGRIVGAIAPHAGYDYSGPVAGYTFKALQENAGGDRAPETVVILGFSHRGGFEGVALLDGGAIRTPLGDAPLDAEANALLTRASPRIVENARPHGQEHSAENEIPFVQAVFPEAKLVVALMGDHDAKTIEAMAHALGALAKQRRLVVVASTDMLHDADYERVTKTDQATLKKLAAMDAGGLAKDWGYDRQIFCGIAPVLTLVQYAAAQGCRAATVLRYRNTGDDFPESRGQWVVGYGAAVFAAQESP